MQILLNSMSKESPWFKDKVIKFYKQKNVPSWKNIQEKEYFFSSIFLNVAIVIIDRKPSLVSSFPKV